MQIYSISFHFPQSFVTFLQILALSFPKSVLVSLNNERKKYILQMCSAHFTRRIIQFEVFFTSWWFLLTKEKKSLISFWYITLFGIFWNVSSSPKSEWWRIIFYLRTIHIWNILVFLTKWFIIYMRLQKNMEFYHNDELWFSLPSPESFVRRQ